MLGRRADSAHPAGSRPVEIGDAERWNLSSRIGRRCCLAWLVAVPGVLGCQLFTAGLTPERANKVNKPLLPPLQAPEGAIQLEVMVVSRPLGDLQLGNTMWQLVDQIGATSATARAQLTANGLRLGQVGTTLPAGLQELLGLTASWGETGEAGPGVSGRRLFLPSGQDSEVQTGESIPDCRITLHTASEAQTRSYTHARCVWRLRPKRLPEGWVNLEFTPEIHYGDLKLRHAATQEGWAYKSGQQAEVCHAQKFDITLNDGEFAIVGMVPGVAESLGKLAFETASEPRQQRLLVVRMVGIVAAKVTPAQ